MHARAWLALPHISAGGRFLLCLVSLVDKTAMLKLSAGISVALEQISCSQTQVPHGTDRGVQTRACPDLFIQGHFPRFICAVTGEMLFLFHGDLDSACQALPKDLSKGSLLIVCLFENHYLVSPLHSRLDFL